MRILQNITNEANQFYTLIYNNVQISLRIRFSSQIESWIADVTYGDKSALGIRMAVGTLHLRSRNMPFDFIIDDTTQSGIDPFRRNDFSDGRCLFYVIDDVDMALIRGVRVPLIGEQNG